MKNDLIYEVNKVTGEVKCTVENCKRDFMRITEKILSQYPERVSYFYKFIAAYHCENHINDKYVGVAKCHPEDTFNEAYGKDLARTQAIIKREDAFQKTLYKIYEDIDNLEEVNTRCLRPNVLDKHFENMIMLLEEGKCLDELLNPEAFANAHHDATNYTPHCCGICDRKTINYTDDARYESIENEWVLVKKKDGSQLEVCKDCFEKMFAKF
jgi:hypothetical protein